MSTSTNILPVATKMASSWLAGIIACRSLFPDSLRQTGSMAFGASFLAERLEDQTAANFLRDLDRDLCTLSLRHGADIGVELGKLMMRINGRGQEASQ